MTDMPPYAQPGQEPQPTSMPPQTPPIAPAPEQQPAPTYQPQPSYAAAPQQPGYAPNPEQAQPNYTPGVSTEQPQTPPPADAPQGAGNDNLAFLSYLGLLVIIPMVVTPKSDFVRFHNRQGLALIGLELVPTAISIISVILGMALPYRISSLIGLPLSLISGAVGILGLVCFIMGLVNVGKKEKKELPIIGKLIADKLPANWG
jgi:uncharacterized membrane protein